jgi:metal-responsive CopG/Arc/MetJ family transcriptional regulator
MKTAISLPDALFKAGDLLAKKLGVSRSELYARALEEYVVKHRADRVTERLNAVYAVEESHMDPALVRAQARSLAADEW